MELDDLLARIGPIVLWVRIAGLLPVAAWTYWVSRNLKLFHIRGQRNSPAWAAGWYFVPVAWWWKPVEVVDEVWRASSPQELHPYDWQRGRGSILVFVWWCVLLAGGVAGFFTKPSTLPVDAGHPALVAHAYVVLLAYFALLGAGAVLTGAVVLSVTRRQREKMEVIWRLTPEEALRHGLVRTFAEEPPPQSAAAAGGATG